VGHSAPTAVYDVKIPDPPFAAHLRQASLRPLARSEECAKLNGGGNDNGKVPVALMAAVSLHFRIFPCRAMAFREINGDFLANSRDGVGSGEGNRRIQISLSSLLFSVGRSRMSRKDEIDVFTAHGSHHFISGYKRLRFLRSAMGANGRGNYQSQNACCNIRFQ
jgi:hypothetical protein